MRYYYYYQLRNTKWAGHVAHTRYIRNSYIIAVGKYEVKIPRYRLRSKRKGGNEEIGERSWTGFNFLRILFTAGFYEDGNEPRV